MERSMEAIVACCAGLDVHQAGVVACLNRGGKRGGKEIRSFGTTRGELAEMCAWLRAGGCTLVAMESTGGLLASRLFRPGGAVRADRRQRPAHQERAGP